MTFEEQIKFLIRNKETINFSGIAKQLEMDAPNFHKVINGKLGLSYERQKKLKQIINKLCHKNTL